MTVVNQLITSPEPNYKRMSQLSHAIKGAAANLICTQLRESALAMEFQSNKVASEKAAAGAVPPERHGEIVVLNVALQNDVTRFRAELVQLGIQISD